MNEIHHTAVIGDDVKLGIGNVIGPYAVIIGPCHLGDGNWLGPHVSIGGPAEIRGPASGRMGQARWRVVGPGVMLGMGSIVTRDIPPFALAFGNPARVGGVNRVGMQRAGVASLVIEHLGARYGEGGDRSRGRRDLH